MYRLKLYKTTYIDLKDEQYNNCKTINLISESTGKLKEKAKEIYLEKNMILIVPIKNFELVKEQK